MFLAVALFAEDSALVKAAKSGTRGKGKSKIVITNESVKKKGGHLSTGAPQAPMPTAKPLPPAAAAKGKPPARKAKAPPPPIPPAEDAMAYLPEDYHPDNIQEPGKPVKVPKEIAAQPQFSQPEVVPPVAPQYTEKP